MLAFYDMMKKSIVMPAHLMDDLEHEAANGRNLFKDFSSVAQSTGTYTGKVRYLTRPQQGVYPTLVVRLGFSSVLQRLGSATIVSCYEWLKSPLINVYQRLFSLQRAASPSSSITSPGNSGCGAEGGCSVSGYLMQAWD